MAGETFLNLTNQLLRRMNEVELTSSDFSAARGVQALAKDAIKNSIAYISRSHQRWPFLFVTGSQVLTIGTTTYNWPSGLKVVDWDSFYIDADTNLGTDSRHLRFIDRDSWMRSHRDKDVDAGALGRDRPSFVFPSSNSGFGVTPSPDRAYTVKYGYWGHQAPLSSFSDVTNIPIEYSDVIVEGGMYYMHLHRDNRENAALTKQEFDRNITYMRSMLINEYDAFVDGRIERFSPRGRAPFWYI